MNFDLLQLIVNTHMANIDKRKPQRDSLCGFRLSEMMGSIENERGTSCHFSADPIVCFMP